MSRPGIRSGRLAFVSVILLTWLVTATCTAMVYRPSVGRFKDTLVLWHEGQFYLFSMYTPDTDANFRMFVQTFNTTHAPGSIGLTPERIGFIAQNGQALFENLKVWSMNLDEPD